MNCFTLKIRNETIEEKYEEKIGEKTIIILIYLIVITVLLVTGIALCFGLGYSNIQIKSKSLGIEYFGYTNVVLLSVSYILFFVRLKFNTKPLTFALLYFNLLNIFMISQFFVLYMKTFLNDTFQAYDFLIYSAYQFITVSYIIFVDNNFFRIFIAYLTILLLFVSSMIRLNYVSPDIFCNIIGPYAMNLVLFYIYCLLYKYCFYYKEKVEFRKTWINDILNHWNSGVIIYDIKKQKVNFINNYLKKFEQFQANCKKETTDLIAVRSSMNMDLSSTSNFGNRDFNETFIRTKNNKNVAEIYDLSKLKNILFKYNIFSKLYDVNPLLPLELRESFTTTPFNEIIELIAKIYSIKEDSSNKFFEEYIYFGHIILKESNENSEEGVFEFYMRGLNNAKGIYYEFMINDVTKTKKLEESRLRDKTLILGKISHEFKNPIIVMDEVINQLIEHENNEDKSLQSINQNKCLCLNKLNFIKNLCQYIIILVKDFEVVASIENNLHLDIFLSTIELNQFLNDIDEIVKTLITKKCQNSQSLTNQFQFNINYNYHVITKIKSDHIRLKQILVNLLSNSVKFIEKGIIELELKEITEDNKNYIRFSVIDTGKGLCEDLINEINQEEKVDKLMNGVLLSVIRKENSDNSLNNTIPTSYGLNIVQKLCKSLNTKLFVYKNIPNGSVFYFDIAYSNNNDMNEHQENEHEYEQKKYKCLEQTVNLNDSKDVSEDSIFGSEIILMPKMKSLNSNIKHNPYNVDFNNCYDLKNEKFAKASTQKIDNLIFDNYSKSSDRRSNSQRTMKIKSLSNTNLPSTGITILRQTKNQSSMSLSKLPDPNSREVSKKAKINQDEIANTNKNDINNNYNNNYSILNTIADNKDKLVYNIKYNNKSKQTQKKIFELKLPFAFLNRDNNQINQSNLNNQENILTSNKQLITLVPDNENNNLPKNSIQNNQQSSNRSKSNYY